MTNSSFSTESGYLKKVKRFWFAVEPVMRYVLPFLILALGVGLVLSYIIGPSKYYMTGDSTDSLRWAYASYESGALISDNFAYAAILPFGGNLILLPFIAIFGYSLAAQIGGLVLFTLLLAVSMYYMATGIGLNRYWSAGLVSTVFLILSSSAKLREIMWEHIFYYNLGILFFCLGVGLVSRILRESSAVMSPDKAPHSLRVWGIFAVSTAVALAFAAWGLGSVIKLFIVTALLVVAAIIILIVSRHRASDWIRLGFLAVFSLLAATDGLQTLICFSLPVFAGIFAERLFDGDTKVFSLKNLRAVGVLLTLGIASAVGYSMIDSITGSVTASYADSYSTYSSMSNWINNFLGFFKNWLSLLGVSVYAGDTLVSMESIINMIRIFGGLILLIAPIIPLFFWRRIKSHGVKIALVGHHAVSIFILFAVTFGNLGGANWRLTPMLGTAVILSFVSAVELIRQKKLAARFGALLLAFLLVMAYPSAAEIKDMDSDRGDNVAWHIAASELELHGLKYGYANFWFAETVTMLSDGKVQVANISESSSTPRKYVYQVPKDSYTDKSDADSYFLLLTQVEATGTDIDGKPVSTPNLSSWLDGQVEAGNVKDSFVITTPGYDLRGHVGKILYVYVFYENIF